MPRLAVVDPASATGRAKELFEGPLKGKHFNIFKGLANSGAALDAYVALSGALGHGTLSAKEREALQLAWGQARRCDYCLAAHTAIGKGAGLSDEQTLEARRGKMQDAKLDALVAFGLALHAEQGFVGQQHLDAVRAAGYNDGHIAEVVANYALATLTNYFNHVNESVVDFPAAQKL
jgi:uncharacterized peroxidase-related enzyme